MLPALLTLLILGLIALIRRRTDRQTNARRYRQHHPRYINPTSQPVRHIDLERPLPSLHDSLTPPWRQELRSPSTLLAIAIILLAALALLGHHLKAW